MKILSVVGARPQFIKAAAVSRALRKNHIEVLVHTGQHYDNNMSRVFFDELEIPRPDYNLGVGSGRHGVQTGTMLVRLEETLLSEKPDWTLVYGDTNSTLAGALAASKLHVRVAHVEAGLRSFNRTMPEEINRVVIDHLSDLLFCPSQPAVDNLAAEGITHGVHIVGDVMADALRSASELARLRSRILEELDLGECRFLLATVHRAENCDNKIRLGKILVALNSIEERVIFPVHPRTRKAMETLGYVPSPKVRLIEPVGYLDMIRLEQSARMVLTDSGGIQKEAYWLGVPCITLRDETEWMETVLAGWNILTGANTERIIHNVKSFQPPSFRPPLYGDGASAPQIADLLSGRNFGIAQPIS
jgi:UDP-N-acetylglucosamine 2-epimerase